MSYHNLVISSGSSGKSPVQTEEIVLEKRREADIDIALLKEQKLRESLLREADHLRELTGGTYDPWGKPGYGAPMKKKGHQKLKFTEYDGFKNDTSFSGLFDNYVQKKMPTPAELAEPDDEVLKSQTKINNIRNELRTVRTMRQQQQQFEYYDPWGKGAGNPRRGNDGSVERYQTIKERGIVPLPNNGITSFSTEGLRDKNVGVGLNTESRYGGGGAPSKTRSGNIKTRFPTTMTRDIYGNMALQEDMSNASMTTSPAELNYNNIAAETSETYDPFGKPGGGAPIVNGGMLVSHRRDINFNRELDTSADKNKRKQAADDYLHELQREMVEQKRTREVSRYEKREPFGELATVVRQGQVGYPRRDPATGGLALQHRGTSDVTKLKFGINATLPKGGVSSEETTARDYYDDLTRLAEERHRQRQKDRETDIRQENEHTEKWSSQWGRPGGGAPVSKEATNRKIKLDQALHGSNDSFAQRNLIPRHISSHENNFEISKDRNALVKQAPGQVHIVAPYGTF